MATSSDWAGMEDSIARLLPSGDAAAQDRTRLLAELSAYARAVVCEVRRIGMNTPTIEERTRTLAWLDRPVFICGHHRSGTTVMQALLDGHPELLVIPSEGTYFSSFLYVAQPNPASQNLDRFAAEWVMRLIDPNFDPHFKLGRSDECCNPYLHFVQRLFAWQAALRSAPPPVTTFSPMLALAAAIRDVTAVHSSPRQWVEKTPLNELHADRLSAFPQARFIHMVRDPGASLSSLLELYRATGISRVSPAVHIHAIAQSMRLALWNQRKYVGRYLVVRYEDLTADPSREMERVRRFMNISAHPSLTIPTVGSHLVHSNSSFGTAEPGVVHRSRSRALSTGNARLVAALAAGEAHQFGYRVTALTPQRRCAIRMWHFPVIALRRIRSDLGRLMSQRFFSGAARSD